MRIAGKRARVGLIAVTAVLIAVGIGACSAPTSVTICAASGTAAGQCLNPQGVATDFETGQAYVADQGNNRVDVFDAPSGDFLFAFGWGVADGTTAALQVCTTTCFKGIGGSGAGQLEQPTRVAVDNISGSLHRHEVYVVGSDYRWQSFEADGTFIRGVGWEVDKSNPEAKLQVCTSLTGCKAGVRGAGSCQLDAGGFRSVPNPISVGPGGNVFLAAFSGSEPNFIGRVEKFDPLGGCLGETKVFEGNLRARALAVDSTEDAWMVLNGDNDFLRKYDLTTGAQLCAPTPGIFTTTLTLDGSDHLFAGQRELRVGGLGELMSVIELDPACTGMRRFGYGQIGSNQLGLARLSSAEGDVLTVEESSGRVPYVKFPPPGPIAVPLSPEVEEIGAVKAKIAAELNPEGKETQVRVQYVEKAVFEAEGFANPQESDPVTIAPGSGIAVIGVKLAQIQIGCQSLGDGGCLKPQTTYRYRVVAENVDGGPSFAEGSPPEFTTPPHILETWASEVGTDTVRLSAKVNPLGLATSGYLEYVDDARFQESGFAEATRLPDPQPPASEAPLQFGEGIGAVTRSALAYPLEEGTLYHYRVVVEDPLGSQTGEPQVFRTFAAQTPTSCPENEAFRLGVARLLADCRAYEMVSPVDKEGGDIVVRPEFTTELPATLNQASATGDRLAYGSYRAYGDSASAPYTVPYIAARDSASGWSSHAIAPPKGPPIYNGVKADNEYRRFSDDLCDGWLTPFSDPPVGGEPLAPGSVTDRVNLYRRGDQLCGGPVYETISNVAPAHQPSDEYKLELQAVSDEGTVAALAANDNLAGTAAPNNPDGKAQLYVKGAGGSPVFACILPGGAVSTGPCQAGTGAVSYFSIGRAGNFTNALSGDGSKLFWTDGAGEGRVYLRENPLASGSECAGAGTPCTIAVSKAAEEEAGTVKSHFWAAAENGSRAVFSSGGGLYEFELAGEATQKIAGGFLGFLGASGNAQWVYFASSEALTGEEENSNGDKAAAGEPNLYLHEAGEPGSIRFVGTLASDDVAPSPGQKTSVTATEPVQHNGQVSEDGLHAAFLSRARLTGYDNTDAASGQADSEAFVYDAVGGVLRCASCNPSGGRPSGINGAKEGTPFWIAARLPTYESVFYAPRALAEDGSRLYFEAADALSARDSNGAIDVYQWEELGAGSCGEADATYSVVAGGCISLISSGQSDHDSVFVDASPSGKDVFFATVSSLLPQDPGQMDIYDARVGGGFAPPSPEAPECEGESCQSPPPAPEFQTPSSNTYAGPGNEKPVKSAPKSCPKGKHKQKSGGKVRCVKNAKKKKQGKKQKRHRRIGARGAGQ